MPETLLQILCARVPLELDTMSTFAGLAFWLVPSASCIPVLKAEMEKLRASNKDAPSFEPHATLIARLQLGGEKGWTPESIIQAARPIVEQCGIITCNIGDVTTRGLYFQCILLALEKQPTLLALNHEMSKLFHLEKQPEYFPHLSFLYADIDAKESKRQIAEMEKAGTLTRHGETVNFAGLDEVQFVSVDLYDCNGKPQEWKRLASIPLGKH